MNGGKGRLKKQKHNLRSIVRINFHITLYTDCVVLLLFGNIELLSRVRILQQKMQQKSAERARGMSQETLEFVSGKIIV